MKSGFVGHTGRQAGVLLDDLGHALEGGRPSHQGDGLHPSPAHMAEDDRAHLLHHRTEQRQQAGLLVGRDLERLGFLEAEAQGSRHHQRKMHASGRLIGRIDHLALPHDGDPGRSAADIHQGAFPQPEHEVRRAGFIDQAAALEAGCLDHVRRGGDFGPGDSGGIGAPG